MDKTRFLIFLSVVLSVWGLSSFYIYRRLSLAFPAGAWRLGFSLAFLALTLAYPLSRFGERLVHCSGLLGRSLDWAVAAGSLWMGIAAYLILACLAFDLLRFAAWALHFAPPLASWPEALSQAWQAWLAKAVLGLSLALVLAGVANAHRPRLNQMELTLDAAKPKACPEELRVALATDIHLGHLVGKADLDRMKALLKDFKPDLLLLGGDVVDEDLKPVIEQDLGQELMGLGAPLGVWAVPGNHEYIGGADAALAYLGEHGIKVLRDQTVLLPNGLALAGRDDKSAHNFLGPRRKPLAELVAGLPAGAPCIVIDHQPPRAAEFVGLPVHLVLSGHTHDGQLWPFSFITKRVFEHSIGLRKAGQAWQYVSPGFGFWGPPARVGNRPEVAGFVVRFKE